VAIAFGAGYVLGARAGREHYDAISRQVRAVRERPEVQSAAGVVSAQAGGLYQRVRGALGARFGQATPDHSFTGGPEMEAQSANGAGTVTSR
jgi:septal ring factor EnvC (AmiA/AmiB activator)